MDKDTKILLMAVVIILVALVSFNISDLTGRIINKNRGVTTLTVSPTIISFGKYDAAKIVTIKVSPGSTGVNNKIILNRGEGRDTHIDSETATICSSSICYDDVTISYRVSSELKDGKYYFEAERENTDQVFSSNKFEIKHLP